MSRDLAGLTCEFRPKVEELIEGCAERGIEMRPFYTLRTLEEQARLWRQSRTRAQINAKVALLRNAGASFLADVILEVGPQFGPPVTNAIPGLSWHQWGRAVDCFWVVDGLAEWSTRKQIELEDGEKVNGYRLYAEVAVDLGLTAGGHWRRFKDWVHVQHFSGSVLDLHESLSKVDDEMRKKFG